jgi:hypothetical protein
MIKKVLFALFGIFKNRIISHFLRTMAEKVDDDTRVYHQYIHGLLPIMAELREASSQEEVNRSIDAVIGHCQKILEEEGANGTDFQMLTYQALFDLIRTLAMNNIALSKRIKALEAKK